jgi:hypothetical protein
MAAILSTSEIHTLISNRLDEEALATKRSPVSSVTLLRNTQKVRLYGTPRFVISESMRFTLPFDVDAVHLADLLRLLRDSEQFIGVNVTVPHKVRVIDFPRRARRQRRAHPGRQHSCPRFKWQTDRLQTPMARDSSKACSLPTPEHPQGFVSSARRDGCFALRRGWLGARRGISR